ncbi:hypothetical protein HPHPH41_0811 [Helicobacter pylori Hp H-41]|nr:hypothetical protein HPHPH41_0811 [Helicobacter pylori Hp H-41]
MVEELQKAIKTTIEKQIDPTIKTRQEYKEEVDDNLDRSTDKFISDLKNSAFYRIDQFKFDFRKEMHERIERDIGNNECERIFKNECEQRVKELDENIKQWFKECGERFDEQIKEDIERFKEEIKDSLKMLERIGINNLSPILILIWIAVLIQ